MFYGNVNKNVIFGNKYAEKIYNKTFNSILFVLFFFRVRSEK